MPTQNQTKRASQKMKRINLMKRKAETMTAKTGDLVWYLAKEQNAKTFYIADIDKKNNAALWTVQRREAMKFHTQQGVHHFIRAFMVNRKDIFLVHAPED